MRPKTGLHCALVYPPLTDPTCGYHSLPYLAAAVRAERDYAISIVDANIESLVWCARPDSIRQMHNGIDETLDRAKRAGAWDRTSYLAYRDALIGSSIDSAAVTDAMAVLRDPARFWDYAKYRTAVLTLERWLKLLASRGRPGMFRQFALANVNLHNTEFFTNPTLLDSLGEPFRQYFVDELIPGLARDAVDVVGISVTYRRQLPFALLIARYVRQMLPHVHLTMGGTDVSQFWKVAKATDAFRALLEFTDTLVIGEGEHALVEILDAHASGREPHGPGIINRRAGASNVSWGPRYENVDALPTPSFRDLPWNLYLSPEPVVCYSPTRGCYWDKCTFCDYGLSNDTPTSPWRQRSLPKVIEDLKAISQESKFVYLSVDVIAPAYLVKLARAIIDHRIDIRWSAELRLERYFDDGHCALLRESGCVAVSVGFESGNQRVLDLIDKGIRVDDVRRVVRALSGANIGVQVMGFRDFPSETYAEALESIEVLQDLREHWIFGGLGDFSLTAGSIVARRPQAFGLISIRPRRTDDIHRRLEFEEARPSKTAEERAEIDRQCERLRHPLQLWRPFMGGIDTAHTLFYLERYGRGVKKQLDTALGVTGDDASLALEGRIVEDAPAALLSFIDAKRPAGAASELTVIATDAGELIACPGFVRRLAPLLDGRLSTPQFVDRAQLLGFSPEASTLVLSFLRDAHLLRYMSPPSRVPRGADLPHPGPRPTGGDDAAAVTTDNSI